MHPNVSPEFSAELVEEKDILEQNLRQAGLSEDEIKSYMNLIDPTSGDFLAGVELKEGMPVIDVRDGVQYRFGIILRKADRRELIVYRTNVLKLPKPLADDVDENLYIVHMFRSKQGATKERDLVALLDLPEVEVIPFSRMVPCYSGIMTQKIHKSRSEGY